MSNGTQTQTEYWRRKHYPTQTCNHEGCNDDSTLSSPIPEDPSPRIPTAIHAVTDSNVKLKGRTIVMMLDGTGDSYDNDNSNVVNFVACLKKDDPNQVSYYQSGIGTYDGQGLKGGITAGVDMAIGSGLGIHIKDAYRFLMQNYREGDRICLLGFSRGAYTVRCLAGMLHKVGLLPRHNRAQVQFAYKFYKNDTKEGWEMSAGFKKTFCTNVQVYFVGVWDCVASVGFIPRKLPFSKTPTSTIRYFRHAMALDEHRAKFKICQWQHQDPAAKPTEIDNTPRAKFKARTEIQKGKIRRVISSCFGSKEEEIEDEEVVEVEKSPNGSISKVKKQEKDDHQRKLEKKFEEADHGNHDHIQTDVSEVWFAGAHADVGGGAVLNHERHMLSRIPLRWMIRQTFECNTGILFSTVPLAETGLDIKTIWPIYKKPQRPIVGPSPTHVEGYEAGVLPPLSRRSTALGVDTQLSKHAHDEKEKDDHPPTQFFNSPTAPPSKIYELDLLPEQVEDHFDALAPINDQLVVAKGWWVLEIFWPVKDRVLKEESEVWEKVVRLNMGRYRVIRELEPRMHWTVRTRILEKGYQVRNMAGRGCYWGIVA